MSKRTYRIRLSGLEATCRDGEAVLVPWHLVSQVQHALNLNAARRIWPQLPRAPATSSLEQRVIRRLQDRCTRRRLESGRLDIFWRAPWISLEAHGLATAAAIIIVPFIPALLASRSGSPEVEAAIRGELPMRFWIAIGIILACICVLFFACIGKLAVLAAQRLSQPRPVAFRATGSGLTVMTDDGHKSDYAWDRIARFSEGQFVLTDGSKLTADFGSSAPAELRCLWRVLEAQRGTDRKTRSVSPLGPLRSFFPTFLWSWVATFIVAGAIGLTLDLETAKFVRLLATVVLMPISLGAGLLLAHWVAHTAHLVESRARQRRRRAKR